MTADTEIELELGSEGEDEDEAYVEYDITSYPSDLTLEGLHQQFVRGDIFIPDYQRKYVWSIRQASLLIESFLLGLPVPPLFLYTTEESKSEVIDGQQRLQSICYFLEGYFGEKTSAGSRKVFALTGLSEKSPFQNKTFVQLEERHQRKFRGSVLRAINIRQLSPAKSNTSVFHIFERLNTGGTTLKAQEIRTAVFRGRIIDQLRELNKDLNWRQILKEQSEDKYQRDAELVLRLFSLFRAWGTYEKPMKEFLNNSMKRNANFDSEQALAFSSRFREVAQQIVRALGEKAFRPKRVINVAVLEAVMVTLLENQNISDEQLLQRYDELMKDMSFGNFIRGATTDTKMVIDRLTRARQVLVG